MIDYCTALSLAFYVNRKPTTSYDFSCRMFSPCKSHIVAYLASRDCESNAEPNDWWHNHNKTIYRTKESGWSAPSGYVEKCSGLNYSFQCFLQEIIRSRVISAVIIRKHGKRNPINEEPLQGDEETACHTRPRKTEIYRC